ncbi:MAG TPA: ABC transporter permease [Vicinamibacteria bacterium]|nr:ABC transporter permease [Vicinamibacteria bacterium]
MRELLRLALGALRAHRLRSFLSMLGIAIGIAAVILLTSIGEGTRAYVLSQFTQFGTNLIGVNPGKAKTLGIPGVLGGTTRKLTIDDAEALARVAGVEKVVPVAVGQARVEAGERGRSVFVYGVTPDIPVVWRFDVRVGSFWPAGDPRRGAPLAVLGPRLARELFGEESPLGRFVRIAGARFRVVGLMAPKGQMLGIDLDDAAYVPVATAMRLFNQDELFEIDLVYSEVRRAREMEAAVTRALAERHGSEDFTVTTQAAMLEVFGNVMNVVTLAVGAIAAISLLVGATGIVTMMWIAVGERTGEIGLVRAVGATRGQVQALFLAEAAALAAVGGAAGVLLGLGGAALLRLAVPGLPVETPLVFVLAALAVSLLTGLLAGVLPARRAALLDPIQALRAE